MEKFLGIPWMEIETIFTILWSFFYLTCGIDLAVKAAKHDWIEWNGTYYQEHAFEAASLFSFVGMVIYGLDGFLKFRNYKNQAPTLSYQIDVQVQ